MTAATSCRRQTEHDRSPMNRIGGVEKSQASLEAGETTSAPSPVTSEKGSDAFYRAALG
ncbi:hypothetical protein [Amycolatopsis sp. MJM2582]|uniref:hypothetical protein n=1 Tax=Amycolatopsis sp. MJM2582 TaxID=1427749 RepID=UPI0013924099|nr:hypothetical protein [Amycolatopsis sp. MJM2582]